MVSIALLNIIFPKIGFDLFNCFVSFLGIPTEILTIELLGGSQNLLFLLLLLLTLATKSLPSLVQIYVFFVRAKSETRQSSFIRLGA